MIYQYTKLDMGWLIDPGQYQTASTQKNIDSKVHIAHMGPTWVLLAQGKSHDGPMNLAIRHTFRLMYIFAYKFYSFLHFVMF